MTLGTPGSLREFELWLSARTAEADAAVPDLLCLPAPLIVRELRRRPELRTAGVLRRLLQVAHDAIERFPLRAHELTSMVVRYARRMKVPAQFAFHARTVQGEAWREHATALRELDRAREAERAIRAARRCFEDTPGRAPHLALCDLIEAPLLHDRGRHVDALFMVRCGGHWFSLAGDHARFLEARMLESWMLWEAGDPEAASELWTQTAEAARRRGDVVLLARLAVKLGVFELRHGSAAEASRFLTEALQLHFAGETSEESARVHWHLAEAAAAQGRFSEAISEYHIARAQLVAAGALTDAAVAAAEAVDLHLLAGREEELPSLTAKLVAVFRDAGMPVNGMEPLAYLRGRAATGTLTRADAILVRSFVEDLPQKPNARFRAP